MSKTSNSGVSRAAAVTAFTLGTIYFAYAFIQRVAPSIMSGELMRDFNVGGTALGSLSAFYFWTYASIQLPVGMLTDHFGPRKLMSLAAALCAVAALGFSWSESLFMASFWRAVIGGSVAFAFVGTLAIAGYWFKHSQMALLAGILQCIGVSGAIFAQGTLRPIVEAQGWRTTMMVLAIVAFILSIMLFFLVPRRSLDQKKIRPRPKPSVADGLRHVVTNGQSWVCAIYGFGIASTMLSFAGLWAVPWLSTVHGYSPSQAAGITSTFFVGWAVASPFVGWLSDFLGKRNTILRSGAVVYIAAFSIIVFATPDNTALLISLLFIAGTGGSTMAICFVSVKELNSPKYTSTAIGLMNMFVVGSGAVMQPLIGWFLDLNWSGEMVDGARVYNEAAYTIGFSSLLVVMVIALVSTFHLRETRCRQLII